MLMYKYLVGLISVTFADKMRNMIQHTLLGQWGKTLDGWMPLSLVKLTGWQYLRVGVFIILVHISLITFSLLRGQRMVLTKLVTINITGLVIKSTSILYLEKQNIHTKVDRIQRFVRKKSSKCLLWSTDRYYSGALRFLQCYWI